MISSFNIVTTLSIGLMIGVEFAVSVFINPVLQQLADQPRAQAIVLFARKLGKAMPFWYSSNLMLLIATWVLHRQASITLPMSAAIGLWALVILLTLIFLVPINNRMAREEAHAHAEQAHREHQRWDSMHRARVIALCAAMIFYLSAIRA